MADLTDDPGPVLCAALAPKRRRVCGGMRSRRGPLDIHWL